MVGFALKKLPYTMRHVCHAAGEWRGASAGGCSNHDTCIENPGFDLALGSLP
jgi:hypothetical protein